MRFGKIGIFFATLIISVAAMAISVSAAGIPKYSSTGDIDYSKAGWAQVVNDYYYVKNSELLKSQWLNLAGFVYYFDDEGKMLSDTTQNIKDKNGKEHKYSFRKNGSLITGWVKNENSGDWIYIDQDGEKLKGENQIGGKPYFFDEGGILKTSVCFIENGTLYSADKNGVVTVYKASVKGWVHLVKIGITHTGLTF